MWTEQAYAFVRERWTAGASAGQISRGLLGLGLHKTRNAVIGVIHRRGWRKTDAPKRVGVVYKVKRAMRATAKARGLVPPLMPAPPVQDEELAPVDPRLTVQRLQAGQCAWPIGDPKEPDFAFCGRATEPERPYCAHHCRVAYQPRPQQERKKRDTSRLASFMARIA